MLAPTIYMNKVRASSYAVSMGSKSGWEKIHRERYVSRAIKGGEFDWMRGRVEKKFDVCDISRPSYINSDVSNIYARMAGRRTSLHNINMLGVRLTCLRHSTRGNISFSTSRTSCKRTYWLQFEISWFLSSHTNCKRACPYLVHICCRDQHSTPCW